MLKSSRFWVSVCCCTVFGFFSFLSASTFLESLPEWQRELALLRTDCLDGSEAIRTSRGAPLHWAQEAFPIRVYIDASLPKHVIAAAWIGAEVWNAVVGERIFEPRISHWESLSYDYSTRNEIVVTFLSPGTSDRYAGMASLSFRSWGTIRIVQIGAKLDMAPGETLHVMLHELGHALGLAHDESDDSLMYPVVNSGSIEPADIAYVRSQLGGCSDELD